jgi:uncharacterized membrane protein
MVKFVFGAVPMALGMGFSFFEAVTVTSAGGFAGVLVFTFASDKILDLLQKRKARKRAENPEAAKQGKKFTRKNRMIVSVKKRFGLLGISILTPLLFSIPIGCFLAVRYFKVKQRIVIFMFASILFWSVLISSIKLLF